MDLYGTDKKRSAWAEPCGKVNHRDVPMRGMYILIRTLLEDVNMFMHKTDVVQFYNCLVEKQELQINTLETVHTLLHPTFQLAVRDDIIRKNPSDGVMEELKKNLGMKTGVRHALTIPQQRVLWNILPRIDIQTTMDIYAEATEEKKQETFGCNNGCILRRAYEDFHLTTKNWRQSRKKKHKK